MHTLIKSELDLWTVGCVWNGTWKPIDDFRDQAEAMACVNYLNGGIGRGRVADLIDKLSELALELKRIRNALP